MFLSQVFRTDNVLFTQRIVIKTDLFIRKHRGNRVALLGVPSLDFWDIILSDFSRAS